ncbi:MULTISPECIES: hypothetical protein [Rhodococcus]|uniref:hypothetical protein n=1 Tax=Rhodococcus TaxID=1827 RepID=UPI001427A652|nr:MULTISPECIES: hypothetical protein [Rhodococcus]QQZ16569.1 hypothetical protein GO592_10550 [Rhodococcus sp. 21391]
MRKSLLLAGLIASGTAVGAMPAGAAPTQPSWSGEYSVSMEVAAYPVEPPPGPFGSS